MATLKLAAILSVLAFPVYAADIPTDIEGSKSLSREDCVNNYYQQCISTICITSDDINCQSNCQRQAEDKCDAEANE